MLALVVHELATNSLRYGSLSARAGTVGVGLARTALGDLTIGWREAGGPPMTAPLRAGFGSAIISRLVPHDLRGEADVRYELAGLKADFLIPARYLSASDGAARRTPPPPSAQETRSLSALGTAQNLQRLGVADVQLESLVEGALAAIADAPPDFAIIDFNLGGESSEPIAAALRGAGVRFVLATGYAEASASFERLGAEAVLRKPCGMTETEGLLAGSDAFQARLDPC